MISDRGIFFEECSEAGEAGHDGTGKWKVELSGRNLRIYRASFAGALRRLVP